jgi:hypothetical protein
MSKKNAGKTRRSGAAGKRAQSKVRAAAAHPEGAGFGAGVAAGMLDVQRNLWKTGLSVLSRGSQLAAASSGATKLTESLQGGLKKLEDVFDQRVRDALRRAGMPSPREMRELQERIAELERMLHNRTPRRGRK